MPKQTPLKNERFFLDDDDIELLESNGICNVPEILKERLRRVKRRRTAARRLEWGLKTWSDHRGECLQFQQIAARYDVRVRWDYLPHFWSFYTVKEVLGKGAYGIVYLAESARDGKDYAVKVVNAFDRLRSDVYITNRLQKKYPAEVKKYLARIMQTASVPYRNPASKQIHFDEINFAIVMEYIEGETLTDVEVPQQRARKSTAIRTMLTSALEALAFLHEHAVIHGDIKPENIMKASADDRIVLLDLGLADYFDSTDPSIRGSPAYFAPELITSNVKNTVETDIFALALSFYDKLVSAEDHEWLYEDEQGQIVFDEAEFHIRIGDAIRQISFADKPLQEVFGAMLELDPRARPTAADALARLGPPP